MAHADGRGSDAPEEAQIVMVDEIVRWKDCRECDGRGWFLINPFDIGASGHAARPDNIRQCPSCKEAFEKRQSK